MQQVDVLFLSRPHQNAREDSISWQGIGRLLSNVSLSESLEKTLILHKVLKDTCYVHLDKTVDLVKILREELKWRCNIIVE